jgi:tRNA threonylcarbamoyladenosine biosynthesis protein TsaE
LLAEINYILANEQACLDMGGRLAKVCPMPCVILLQGQLGMGKTTLTRGFLRELGIKTAIKSPTFTLVEAYHLAHCEIFHFDLYRIESVEELEHIGWRDYFGKHSICLIEWPERAQGAIAKADLICGLSLHSDGRLLKLYAKSDKGKAILQELSNK